MANGQGEDDQPIVPDIAQDAVITYAVAPKAGVSTLQRFAKVPGILASFDALVQPIKYATPDLGIELAQLSLSGVGDLNRPGQALS
jgi:hypothetical protein